MQNLEPVLEKYGWTAKYIPSAPPFKIEISNSKGNHVFTITYRKLNYIFEDTGGNKILSGRGQMAVSLEKVLTQYYYCKPLERI